MARRWLQFGLGTLLGTMFVLAIVFIAAGYVYRSRLSRVVIVPVPVTGKVMVNGKPAASWKITFRYTSFDGQGEDAFALTDTAGNFCMVTPKTTPLGVWPGEYAVGIEPKPFIGDYPSANFIDWSRYPTRYTIPEYSGLTATVTQSGPNVFEFQLTGGP